MDKDVTLRKIGDAFRAYLVITSGVNTGVEDVQKPASGMVGVAGLEPPTSSALESHPPPRESF